MHIPLIPPVVCTSLSALLFIVLFIKSHILFLHILLFCTFLYSTAHFTFYILFLFLPIYMLLCGVTFIYFFYSLHCPLSGPDLTYISLLIIPCIIYYVTNKETLNLEPWNPTVNCCRILVMAYWHNIHINFNGRFVTSSVDRPWQDNFHVRCRHGVSLLLFRRRFPLLFFIRHLYLSGIARLG